MIYIEQKKFDKRDRFYVSLLDENGNAVGTSRLVDPRVSRVIDGDDVYFLLRRTDGSSDDEFYEYMNGDQMMHKPFKTRRFTATAIRRFECFLEIRSLDRRFLTLDDWQAFEYFILGQQFVPNVYRSKLTVRSVTSANGYLTAVQRFLRGVGIHYAFLEQETKGRRYLDFGGMLLMYTFTKNVRTLRGSVHGDDWVPNYVNPGQYKALQDIVARRGDRTAHILLTLMYIYGMRLGECLGLTQEDIVMFGDVSDGHAPVPVLRLRNRVTDKEYQHAKLLPTMTHDTYRALGPRTYVLITRAFYEELQNYVQDTMSDLSIRFPDRFALAEASILTDDFDQDKNHYIFFNRYGKPLTDAAWNARLKQYYREAGVVVDQGRKQVNLSHQLRHGCAMLYSRFLPADRRMTMEQLRRFLRHSRLESTQVYNRPTPYEEYLRLEDFQSEMASDMDFLNDGYEELDTLWKKESRRRGYDPAEYDYDDNSVADEATIEMDVD